MVGAFATKFARCFVRLSSLTEGLAAQARNEIVTAINEVAGRLATVVANTTVQPTLRLTNSSDQPALVSFVVGGQAVSITVLGDGADEIKMEMSQLLSSVTGLKRLMSLSTEEEASTIIAKIAAKVHNGENNSSQGQRSR